MALQRGSDSTVMSLLWAVQLRSPCPSRSSYYLCVFQSRLFFQWYVVLGRLQLQIPLKHWLPFPPGPVSSLCRNSLSVIFLPCLVLWRCKAKECLSGFSHYTLVIVIFISAGTYQVYVSVCLSVSLPVCMCVCLLLYMFVVHIQSLYL